MENITLQKFALSLIHILDREYLSKYDTLEIDSRIRYQEPFSEVIEVEKEYSIASNESEEDNTYPVSYTHLLTACLHLQDMAAKIFRQIVVIGMNYVISKFYVFKRRED